MERGNWAIVLNLDPRQAHTRWRRYYQAVPNLVKVCVRYDITTHLKSCARGEQVAMAVVSQLRHLAGWNM